MVFDIALFGRGSKLNVVVCFVVVFGPPQPVEQVDLDGVSPLARREMSEASKEHDLGTEMVDDLSADEGEFV
jgi:hypothetical protein